MDRESGIHCEVAARIQNDLSFRMLGDPLRDLLRMLFVQLGHRMVESCEKIELSTVRPDPGDRRLLLVEIAQYCRRSRELVGVAGRGEERNRDERNPRGIRERKMTDR